MRLQFDYVTEIRILYRFFSVFRIFLPYAWRLWHYVRGAGAVSNRKSARVTISTEAPPPKSLEVEPGNGASQDEVSLNDILDDVIAHHQWMM